MKRTLPLLLLLFTIGLLQAQDINISHYPFYRDGINPSSFSQANTLNLFILHNSQFSGFEDQPHTQIIDASYHAQGNKLGLHVLNDVIGIDKTMNFKLRYAKAFTLSNQSTFSLGLAAGAIHNRLETSEMVFEFDDDPLSYENHSQTQFDFDFGAEFQFSKLQLGLSVNHLNRLVDDANETLLAPHYYGYAQYALTPGTTFRFYPNVTTRLWQNSFWTEMGLLTFYKDIVWIGAHYSGNHDLSLSTGANVLSNIMLGYAFKSNMNGEILSAFGTNTHEVFLNISFNRQNVNIKTPRFID